MNSATTTTWGFLLRITGKALMLFAACNIFFAAAYPVEWLGHFTLYHRVLRERERLPYGENPAQWHNISVTNLPAMLASHAISRPKAADEFRVVLIGDSSVWGWLLQANETLAAAINTRQEQIGEKRIIAYNLGYPELSITKDLLLLDAALAFEADLILWPVTLQSLQNEKILSTALVQNNPDRMRPLIENYELPFGVDDRRFVNPVFWQRTIIGQRRQLADLIRLQSYGFTWQATGIDFYQSDYTPRRSDFDQDLAWGSFPEPIELTPNDLALDIVVAGIQQAEPIPVLLINEPIFISSGENSDLRYNSFYPRWAYDQYRELLAGLAREHGWKIVDLWDTIAPDEFTDTPVHLTPQGTRQLAIQMIEAIRNIGNPES